MPVLSKGSLKIDHTDDGQGQAVVLIHSSVSANRQWRALTEALKDSYRVLAINLFGYGETTPWPGISPQSLYAQARLVLALSEEVGSPIHLVGHSFGGSVALKAAMPARPTGWKPYSSRAESVLPAQAARPNTGIFGITRSARSCEVLRLIRRLAKGRGTLC